MRNPSWAHKLTVVACLSLTITLLQPPPMSRGHAEGVPEKTPTLTPDEQRTREAILQAVADAQLELYAGYFLDVEIVTVDDGFAVVEGLAKERNTGESVATEGVIILAHRIDDTWQVALPGTDLFNAWLPLYQTLFSLRVSNLLCCPASHLKLHLPCRLPVTISCPTLQALDVS